MDVEQLLEGVIRFSNFMTSRLIVSGIVFYVLSGFMDIGSASEGFLPGIELVNQVVQNYQTIFDMLGVSDFALLLILFMFLTTIHIIYVVFEGVGEYLPPAILPISGWIAVDDVTLKAFETLREARGEEHTEEENQRLYEFKKKLREIEQASDQEYHSKLEGTHSTFRISKTFVLFSAAAWIYAMIADNYSGNTAFLPLIFALSLLTALFAAFSIFRSNHSRVSNLRQNIVAEILEFSRIWVSEAHQQKLFADCTPARQLKPASFAVVVPVYGTLDMLVQDVRNWRQRKSSR